MLHNILTLGTAVSMSMVMAAAVSQGDAAHLGRPTPALWTKSVSTFHLVPSQNSTVGIVVNDWAADQPEPQEVWAVFRQTGTIDAATPYVFQSGSQSRVDKYRNILKNDPRASILRPPELLEFIKAALDDTTVASGGLPTNGRPSLSTTKIHLLRTIVGSGSRMPSTRKEFMK